MRFSPIRPSPVKNPKSDARRAAGKRKADSLTSWRAEFTAARKALQDTGYTGSLCLKKGMPMYTKIQEIRQASHAARYRRENPKMAAV